MAISLVLFLACALILLAFSNRSRYGLPFLFLICGIIATTLSVLFQSYSTSAYSPPEYFPLRALDLSIYRYIGDIRVPITFMQTLRNLGRLVYCAGIMLFLSVIYRNRLLDETKKRRLLSGLLFVATAALPVICFLFYSPSSAYHMYIKYYSLTGAVRERYRDLIILADRCMHIATLVFVFSPVLLLLTLYSAKKITYFPETLAVLALCVTVFNLFFYLSFLTGAFQESAVTVFQSAFWFFCGVSKFPHLYTLVYPVFACSILVFLLVNTNKLFSRELVLFSREHMLKKRMNELNQNLKDVFHTEKNLMFSINILANKVKDKYGTEEGLKQLERLIDVASQRMETISSALDRIKELHLKAGSFDLRAVADDTIANIEIPAEVTIVKKYCGIPARCSIDPYHTRCALNNLINNSIDALMISGRLDKRIVITINLSKAWVYLSVWDNGTGITKNAMQQIMMPFVSTKSKSGNWGIGLPYAFRVINTQLGQIRIKSDDRENRQFTQVDILLPRDRRNRYSNDTHSDR